MAMVMLSASVGRFSVCCVRDFFLDYENKAQGSFQSASWVQMKVHRGEWIPTHFQLKPYALWNVAGALFSESKKIILNNALNPKIPVVV